MLDWIKNITQNLLWRGGERPSIPIPDPRQVGDMGEVIASDSFLTKLKNAFSTSELDIDKRIERVQGRLKEIREHRVLTKEKFVTPDAIKYEGANISIQIFKPTPISPTKKMGEIRRETVYNKVSENWRLISPEILNLFFILYEYIDKKKLNTCVEIIDGIKMKNIDKNIEVKEALDKVNTLIVDIRKDHKEKENNKLTKKFKDIIKVKVKS